MKMSWKTDALMLGALGVGAYVVVTNIDKISAWITGQFAAGARAAAAATGQAAQNVVFGATPQAITEGITSVVAGTGGKPSIAGDIYGLLIPGVGPVGVAAANLKSIFPSPVKKAAELPTTAVVGGLGYSGTPEFLLSKFTSSSAAAPYNPNLTVTTSATNAPTGVQKIGLTAEQRYAQTFADPGSEAWIKAFGK